MRPVIFLDFDGVLNAAASLEIDASIDLYSADMLEASMVGRLAQLALATDALVVVSSSWRIRRTKDELHAILASKGYAGGIYDLTPRGTNRDKEIAEWLTRHPDVVSFVILDDELIEEGLAHRHVRTDPTRGLTDNDVARALGLLIGS